MNLEARAELLRALDYLQQHGSPSSMLVMTVRTTSNGLLAGIEDGEFRLDYARAGWLDVIRTHRFASFCRTKGITVCRVRWGKERISRAAIGRVPSAAADVIDGCFAAVYGETGPFGLELRTFDWRAPSPA
jgi:hypothetical protein